MDVPHPVHVKGRQQVQVRLGTFTALANEGHPALLIPETSPLSLLTLILKVFILLPPESLPHNILL